jgi:GntR family transcriptional regulator
MLINTVIVKTYIYFLKRKILKDFFFTMISFTLAASNCIYMKLKIDHNSATPLHSQAEKLLRELLNKEEYQKGKLLPNEVDLSKQLNISRNTLRQAINKLVYEGLLVRKKGYGTKAAQKGISGRAKNWLSFTQEMKALGILVHNFELHISWVIPEDEVLTFFGLTPNTRVLALERLRGKENFPFVYFKSYFNPEVGLTGNEDFSQPLYEILEQKMGVVASISYEEISAIKSSAYLCHKLNIKSDDPVLFRKRFVFDVSKRPIEYNLGYYRGDSFVFTIESDRK